MKFAFNATRVERGITRTSEAAGCCWGGKAEVANAVMMMTPIKPSNTMIVVTFFRTLHFPDQVRPGSSDNAKPDRTAIGPLANCGAPPGRRNQVNFTGCRRR